MNAFCSCPKVLPQPLVQLLSPSLGAVAVFRRGIALLLPTQGASLRESFSHLSVAPSGHLRSSRRSLCATDRNEGSLMEPVSYSLQAVLRGALILGLSLTVAQIPSARMLLICLFLLPVQHSSFAGFGSVTK